MLRRTLTAFLCLAAAIPALAQTQPFAVITASKLTNSEGTALATGKFCATPVDEYARPISFTIPGQGQFTTRKVCANVGNGAITTAVDSGGTFQLANTQQVLNGLCFNISVTDSSDNSTTLGGGTTTSNSGYNCVQMNSSWCSVVGGVYTCNFDNYTPNTPIVGVASVPSQLVTPASQTTINGVLAGDGAHVGAANSIQVQNAIGPNVYDPAGSAAAALSAAQAAQTTADNASTNASSALSGSADDATARSALTGSANDSTARSSVSAETTRAEAAESTNATAAAAALSGSANDSVARAQVQSGSGYALGAYGSGSSATVGPSHVTTDSTGNNLNAPGRVTAGAITSTIFAPSGFTAYGDSITYCDNNGVTNDLNCYVKRLAGRLGIPDPNITIYAQAGKQACDLTNAQMFPNDTGPEATANPKLRTMQIGINDVSFGGGGSGGNGPTSPPFPYITTFATCWKAAAAWGAVPPTAKMLAASAATTGTCAVDSTYTANPGEKCTVSGSTISFNNFTTPVNGAVYAWVRYIDGDTGAWTYQLDSGTPVAQTTALTPAIATNSGGTQGVGLIRISGVTAGTHTLKFTQTANGTMSVIAIGWSPATVTAAKPWMIVGDMSNELNGTNQTAVNAYRAEITADYALLASDGLNLALAPVSQHVLATTAAGDMFNGIHPNETGHQEYYAAFLDPIAGREPNPGMASWTDLDCKWVNGGATVTLPASAPPTCVVANGPGTVVLPNVGAISGPSYTPLDQEQVVILVSLNGASTITISGATGGNAPASVTGASVTLINIGGGTWYVVSTTALPVYSGLAASLNSPLLNTNQANQAGSGLAGAESLFANGGNDEGRVFGSAFGNFATVDVRPSGWYWAHCFYTGSGASVTTMAAATANCPWVVGTAGPALKVGAAIASATTIAPVSPVFHVTGTTAIATITAPTLCTQTGMSCTIRIIPDGAFTTTTAGNIAIASTAMVSRVLSMTYDPGTLKWYPSY